MLVLPLLLAACAPQSKGPVAYDWKNVQIVGGGFVDGIIFHPSAAGVRYARTDMGGAYRWDEGRDQWQPMLDWVSFQDSNLMGVESIAVDSQDPDRVYLACGTYTNDRTPDGAILRSEDRGRTFQRVDLPIKFGGNENGRGNGERLVVDPADGNILYLATRHVGLWKSRDAGKSWSRLAGFPADDAIFVKIAPDRTVYAGNLLSSTDGGASWKQVPGAPTQLHPNRAVFTGDGALIVAYGDSPGPSKMTDGGVWRYQSGQWSDISPEHGKFGYAAVSADPRDPKTLIVSSFGRPAGEDIFRSRDGGKSWKAVFANGGQYDYSRAPYVRPTAIHWLFDIEIDPLNPDHVLFTTGYGGWESFDLTALDRGQPTHWRVMSKGIEESVGLGLYSPSRGAPLVSALGDYGGFVHEDLDQPAPQGAMAPPRFSDTMAVAGGALAPDIMVRIGVADFNKSGPTLSYSLDAGKSWQPTIAMPKPDAKGGDLAVSADGQRWLWVPKDGEALLTADHGAHWLVPGGLPLHVKIAADPLDPMIFYALSLPDNGLYISHDGGRVFSGRRLDLPGPKYQAGWRGDARGGQDKIYATPGKSGDLWVAAADGLYHSTNSGESYVRSMPVEWVEAFGFGKDALYLVGKVSGQAGIFRSDDLGASWRRINDDAHQWGLILQIAGDPKTYGRVYLGTHGRGILYGDPK